MASSIVLSDNGASSGSAGIKTSGGNDGVLLLQTTTAGGTATTAVTIDTSQNVTTAGKINGLTVGKGAGSVSTNTAVGASALVSNTTGASNTALGYESMYANTTGNFNVAMGRDSLDTNTTGSNNTAIGYSALQANTTASNNTAVGYQAGYSNTTGAQSVFVGQSAGYTNTTGTQQVFVGLNAGYSTTGNYNTFIGAGSGYSVSSGTKNTIIGSYSGNQGGLDIRTASNNIVLSDGDGNPRLWIDNLGATYFRDISGSGSYFQVNPTGFVLARATSAVTDTFNYYNATAGAYRFYVTSGGTVYATNTTISAISDIRFKENIRDLDAGLAEVMSLKPRLYDWKEGKGANIKNARGFIAQEFEQVFPDLIDEWKDPAPEGEEPYKSVRQDLIPVLVKAIQELKAEIDALKGQA